MRDQLASKNFFIGVDKQMSDDIDVCRDLAAIEDEYIIENVRRKAALIEVQPTGNCLACGEPLKESARWCNADCRDDWERMRLLKRI